MEKQEFERIVDYIEGMYHRKLETKELKVLKGEVNFCKDFEEFKNKFAFTLLKRVEYFTVQQLHQLIEERKETENFLKLNGLNSFDELYEN